MAVIDPQGLFYGERLAACSDLAQLYWPRLFLAANGLARMELSYSQIVSECFRNFRKIPKDGELWEVIAEYERCFLAVTYEAEGTWWVQFVTSERLLPRHKTKKDLRTPSPPVDLIEASEKDYLEWKRAKGFGYQRFQKSAESSAKFPIGVGEGVGVGKGVGEGEEQQTLAQLPLASVPAVVPPQTRNPVEAIYLQYPRKVAKKDALKAISKAVATLQTAGRTEREAQEYLYRRTQAYARSPAGQNGEYTPHPSTWFNRGSFDDDEQEWQRTGENGAGSGRKTFGQLKHDSIVGNVARALGHEPVAAGSDHHRTGLSSGGHR